MDRKGKFFNAIYIGSGLITSAGVLLVLAKIYGYIGLILLFFGGLIFLQALGIALLLLDIAVDIICILDSGKYLTEMREQ